MYSEPLKFTAIHFGIPGKCSRKYLVGTDAMFPVSADA